MSDDRCDGVIDHRLEGDDWICKYVSEEVAQPFIKGNLDDYGHKVKQAYAVDDGYVVVYAINLDFNWRSLKRFIDDARILILEPDDILAIEYDANLSEDNLNRILQQIKLHTERKVMIIAGGGRLRVVRESELASS